MKGEDDILEDGFRVVETILAERGMEVPELEYSRDNRADVLLDMGETKIVIEAKRRFHPSGVKQLQSYTNDSAVALIVVADRISEKTLDACKQEGVCIVDLHGNGWLELPGFYYERFVPSASRNRPVSSGTPFTAKASRIVRVLLEDPGRGWEQGTLIDETGVSQGYASKVIQLLKANGYIRINRGAVDVIEVIAAEALLDDWAAHYRFDRHAIRNYAMSFKTYDVGLSKLDRSLHREQIKYAFTGWSAAHLSAPYGTSQQLMAYVDRFPESDYIIPAQGRGNVVLYVPHDEGLLHSSINENGFKVVTGAQLYLDLLKMPGRASEQAAVVRDKLLSKWGVDTG